MRLLITIIFLFTNYSHAMSLDSAINYALINNKDLKISSLDIQSSLGAIKSDSSIYDINFSANFEYQDLKSPSTSAFANNDKVNEAITSYSFGFDGYLESGTKYFLTPFKLKKIESDLGTNSMSPKWESSFELGLSQNILKDFGPSVNNSFIIVSKNNSKISKIQFEKMVSKTILNVKTSFYNALLAKKNIELANSSLALAEDLVKKNEYQVEAGTLPKLSLLQAKAAVAFRQVELIKAENNYDLSLDNFKISISMPLDEPVNLDGIIEKNSEAISELSDVSFIAFNNRPEIRQRELKIKSSQQMVEYYRNQLLPDFNLEASLGYSGLGGSKSNNYSSAILGPPSIDSKYDSGLNDSIDNLRSGENLSWKVGASINIPLGNVKAKGNLKSAKAKMEIDSIKLEQLLDLVSLEARSSWRDVITNLKNIDAAKIGLELQKEILENEQERFNIGLSKTNDVLEAQTELIEAELAYNKSLADFNISLNEHKYSLGILLKDKKIVLDN